MEIGLLNDFNNQNIRFHGDKVLIAMKINGCRISNVYSRFANEYCASSYPRDLSQLTISDNYTIKAAMINGLI